jgi:hypothetical protein
MPDHEHDGVAGDANALEAPPAATPPSPLVNAHEPDTNGSGDAGVATIAALAEDLEYTLTVGQAVERIIASRRKAPSERSMQRYCIERRLAAQKIRTVYGSEWLINETSLARFIENEPVVTGSASVANTPDIATPASPIAPNSFIGRAATNDSGDAGTADRESMATPVGERRTLSQVLIENARLLAQVEGKDAIIVELKEDRTFLREEVREGRRSRDDVKGIAERMLDTLKTMAVGRLSMPTSSPQPPVEATIIDAEGRQM